MEVDRLLEAFGACEATAPDLGRLDFAIVGPEDDDVDDVPTGAF